MVIKVIILLISSVKHFPAIASDKVINGYKRLWEYRFSRNLSINQTYLFWNRYDMLQMPRPSSRQTGKKGGVFYVISLFSTWTVYQYFGKYSRQFDTTGASAVSVELQRGN